MTRPFWLTKLLIRTGLARYLPIARRLSDGGPGFIRYYSDRVLAAPIEELLDPAYLPTPPGADSIDLNARTPRFEAPNPETPLTIRSEPLLPRGSLELRDAIADLYIRRDCRAVDPMSEVLITHGATSGFAAALDALINPGDRVVLFDPSSPLFSLGARSRRAAIRWVPTWTEDGRCRYLPANFEQAMRGAKLLILADPVNPTGASFSPEDYQHIVWIAASYDVLLLIDESFARYRYDKLGTSAAMLPGAESRTLTIGSISQSHGLAPARVGWLCGSKYLIQACTLMANLSAPFVPPAAQQIATQALKRREEDFPPTLATFQSRRRYLFDRLVTLGFEPEWPGCGYFMWVPLPFEKLDSRRFAERLLEGERVLVGPGVAFGPSGAHHIRISFAVEDGRLREGLSRIGRFVSRLRESDKSKRPQKMTASNHSDTLLSETMGATEATLHEAPPQPVFTRV